MSLICRDLKDAWHDELTPSRRLKYHTNIVNDVKYHPQEPRLLGSVSDDLTTQFKDLRQSGDDQATLKMGQGHTDAINSISFAPTMERIFVTGSADRTVAVWDLRKPDKPYHTSKGHMNAITSLEWDPRGGTLVCSGGYDRRVCMWDLSRIGKEQGPEEAEEGPPELVFIHGGHTNHVSDLDWNPHLRNTVCSISEDNLCEVWTAAKSIIDADFAKMPTSEVGPVA